jgi:hypothetical protein
VAVVQTSRALARLILKASFFRRGRFRTCPLGGLVENPALLRQFNVSSMHHIVRVGRISLPLARLILKASPCRAGRGLIKIKGVRSVPSITRSHHFLILFLPFSYLLPLQLLVLPGAVLLP